MPQPDLTETLQMLMRRHGISSVLHSLADIQTTLERLAPSPPSRRRRNVERKSSAVDYVGRMILPPGKSEVMARAAQCFEERVFLPNIGDIREFCRIHGIDLSKSISRVNSIPRIFVFLAAMDTEWITKVLDEGAFSGPTRLAPIADAIRNRSSGRNPARFHEILQPMSSAATADGSKNR